MFTIQNVTFLKNGPPVRKYKIGTTTAPDGNIVWKQSAIQKRAFFEKKVRFYLLLSNFCTLFAKNGLFAMIWILYETTHKSGGYYYTYYNV